MHYFLPAAHASATNGKLLDKVVKVGRTARSFACLFTPSVLIRLRQSEGAALPSCFVCNFCASPLLGSARLGGKHSVRSDSEGGSEIHLFTYLRRCLLSSVSSSVLLFFALRTGGGGIEVRNFPQFIAIFPQFFPQFFCFALLTRLQVTLAVNAEPYWCTQFCRTMRLLFAHA